MGGQPRSLSLTRTSHKHDSEAEGCRTFAGLPRHFHEAAVVNPNRIHLSSISLSWKKKKNLLFLRDVRTLPPRPWPYASGTGRGDTWLDGGLEIGLEYTRRPANPALPPALVWLGRAGRLASPSWPGPVTPRDPDAPPCVSAGSAGQGRQFASSAYRTIKIRGVRALCVSPVHWFPATSSSGGSTDQLAAGSPRPRVERRF